MSPLIRNEDRVAYLRLESAKMRQGRLAADKAYREFSLNLDFYAKSLIDAAREAARNGKIGIFGELATIELPMQLGEVSKNHKLWTLMIKTLRMKVAELSHERMRKIRIDVYLSSSESMLPQRFLATIYPIK